MKNMKINKAAEDDAEKIAEIEKRCFSHPRSLEEIKKELEDKIFLYFVAKDDDDTLLGYVGAVAVLDELSITNIACEISARRIGVGKNLIKFLKTYGKENNFAYIFLEVRKSNAAAIGLYEKCGFEKIGERKNFYDLPKEDALLYKFEIR